VLARAGQYDSARRTMQASRKAAKGDPELDVYEAGVRVLLGEEQQALTLLERYAAYSPAQVGIIKGDPAFDRLHQYRRFQQLTAASP
jgi:hypothetical protein